jgi:hypothetical protein
MLLPAPRGLPVAIIGIAQRRADDDDLRHTFCLVHAFEPIHVEPSSPPGRPPRPASPSRPNRPARPERRPRHPSPTPCRKADRRTLALLDVYVASLGEELIVPYSPQLNPPRWEVGHVAWFQDYWIARNRQRERGIAAEPAHDRPSGRLAQADSWFNSSLVPHQNRRDLPLPDFAATRDYLAESLAETLDLLAVTPETDDDLYFYRLALFHEDMHTEAAVYMAQALNIPLPAALLTPARALPENRALQLPAQNLAAWLQRRRFRLRQRTGGSPGGGCGPVKLTVAC